MTKSEIRKHSIDEYTQPKGPIRFTEWQQHEIDCLSWYRWFESRSIPAAIIKRNTGSRKDGLYAVLRNWKGNQPINPKWAEQFDILMACNDFR